MSIQEHRGEPGVEKGRTMEIHIVESAEAGGVVVADLFEEVLRARGEEGAVLGLAAYLAAAGFARHAVRRLGGINGDVLGATIETGTAATLVAAVLLL